jgi:hypothetical protein
VYFPAVAPPDACEAAGEDEIAILVAAVNAALLRKFLRLETVSASLFCEYNDID